MPVIYGTHRTWFFTWNYADHGSEALLRAYPHRYLMYGREVGKKSQIPHLHGILVLKTPCRMIALSKHFGTVHWEVPNPDDKSSYAKWFNYCIKEDKEFFEDDCRQKRGPKPPCDQPLPLELTQPPPFDLDSIVERNLPKLIIFKNLYPRR